MTQTINTTEGLRWLTMERDAAFQRRALGTEFSNSTPELWQQAIDILRLRPFPAQLNEEELKAMPYGIGVHVTHCCADHGCKYGTTCPVADLRIVQQAHRCEECYERQERMDEILQGVEQAAAEAFPENEFTQKAVVLSFREAFTKGARWAASKGA